MRNKLNIKNLFLTVAVLSILGVSGASAAQYGVTCDIGVYPFDTTATPFLNTYYPQKITPQSACKQRLAYPQSSSVGVPYSPVPPSTTANQVKAGDEDMQVPWVIHEHAVYNDSGPLGPNYYYKMPLEQFEITIQPDLSKLDLGTALQNLKCFTPVPLGSNIDTAPVDDCSGMMSNLYGGTQVTKQVSGNKVIVRWKFGTNTYYEKPILFGANGSSFTVTQNGQPKTLNLSSPESPWRHAEFKVNFPTKDNNEEIWAATTTSRALVTDLAIRKINYNDHKTDGCVGGDVNNANSGWCYLNPYTYNSYPKVTLNQGGTNRTYYWYPIGSVASIWKKPPQTPAVCDDLSLAISQGGNTYSPSNLTGLQPNQPMNLVVTPTFNPSNQSVPLEYRWTGNLNAQAEGFFKDFTSAPQQANPFTDDDVGAYYSGGDAGTVVQVIALDQGAPQSQCQVQFTIPQTPQNPTCVDVTLSPNTVNAPGTTNYTATVSFDDGQTYNTTVEWSGNGNFSAGTTQTNATNTFLNNFTTNATSASVNVKVVNLPPGVDNSPACQQGATVTSTDDGMCVDLFANYSTPVEAGDVILIDPTAVYSGNLQPSQIQWSETGNGFFRDPITNQVFNGTNVFPHTRVFFYHAVTQGDTFTLTAIPNPTNNPACTLSETVVEPPDQDEKCDYLNFDIQNDEICVDVDPDYNGEFEWIIDGGTPFVTPDECQPYDEDKSYEVEAIDAENPAICRDEIEPDDTSDDCTYFEFDFPGDQICIDTDYNGPIDWLIDGNSETADDDECFTYNPGISYEADAANTNNPLCRDEVEPDEPELRKEARRGNGPTYSMDVLTLRSDDATVDYKLTYTPLTNQTYSTFITDTISKGYIEAILLPGDSGINPGRIEYNNDMEVWVGASQIPSCLSLPDDAEIEDCYVGDIGNGGVRLVRVQGTATIFYSGSVESALTDEVCREGVVCQEKYLNNAETDDSVIHVEDEEYDVPEVTSNEIKAQIFCQYILTRAAGDIFLENDLSTGVDISICSKFRSSTGIIITPGDEEAPPLVSTGPGETTIKAIGHEVCTAGQAGTVSNELAELYGSQVSGLSSQICEVQLRTGSPWKQEIITNSIDENKTRASRWGEDASLPATLDTVINALGLGTSLYADQDVYHYKGRDVTSGNIHMDEVGAKTIIVEDGDLYITDDIMYTGTCYDTPCTVRDVGSLAFIVLNGSIYVDANVENISGVFFVQEGDRDGSGRLFSGTGPGNANERSDVQLKVFGSVYGDIDPLFENRFFSGDPTSDLGGIVVRFDQRVILNTPPGLRDILNLSQTEVAR